eukprot:616405-Pyramimonas_sp.AAC.1
MTAWSGPGLAGSGQGAVWPANHTANGAPAWSSRSSGHSAEWKKDPDGRWHWIGQAPGTSTPRARQWTCK